ncbi:hypothetical protein [Sphingomonas sanxanigenens]|uniref:hypothetical protein n=1 Tax=Sphingomonas sanxanigenens TaxID=397260 RepID=UPI0013013018|nr:hypothetical protein [Sphingomonas sanxanigenens]
MSEFAKIPSIRVHYMLAVVKALGAHGGSSSPAAVYAWLSTNTQRRDQVTPDGVTPEQHFQREVRFARQELADGGVLTSVDGLWVLIDLAAAPHLSADDARRIIRENRRRREEKAAQKLAGTSINIETGTKRPGHREVGPTTGPRPCSWEGQIFRDDEPAWTYAFAFEGSDLWKIGFAGDIDERLARVNQHVPVELLERRWIAVLSTHWPTQSMAYAMEQEVLFRLSGQRTMFERVRCSLGQLHSAWEDARAALEAKYASITAY